MTYAFVIDGCRVGGCSLQSATSVTGRVQGGGGGGGEGGCDLQGHVGGGER
jgi:hypothetical protein